LNQKNSTNRNHQSQILVQEKAYEGQQKGAQWGAKNHHHSTLCNTIGYQNLTTSQMMNMPSNTSQISNQDSKMQMRPSSSMMQSNSQNSNSKFNFVPQLFEGNSFQNDCKKIRKSGLTLLKMNQQSQKGESSRSRLNMNINGQQ
jgi:23S rRNA U2552 (ribose-2'-O)-methylase RlmE/FtsJ